MTKYEKFLESIEKTYKLKIQLNSHTKIINFFEKFNEKLELKKDLIKKFNHPTIISTQPIKNTNPEKPDFFMSSTITKTQKSKIYDKEENIWKTYENKFLGDTALTGKNQYQYLSPQKTIMTEKNYNDIKSDKEIYETEILNAMGDFFNAYGKTIKEDIDINLHNFFSCLSSFSKIDAKIENHYIICNKLISQTKSSGTDFLVESERYKTAILKGTEEVITFITLLHDVTEKIIQ